tara:strand:+ start:804 stop:1598 length:795 start_codon:yes stop_codon:yes gene_type:complete
MIDFHNHVLPNVDDGSKSLKMSLNMLKSAAAQGITDVVNTVHYFHPKVKDGKITLDNILEKTASLQNEIDKHSIPIKIHCGSEIFFRSNLVELKNDPLATFFHGKYMLIEFDLFHIPSIYKQELFNLKMEGITPIIAHPERYRAIHRNLNIIPNLLEAGCIIQLDAGSLLGHFGSKVKLIADKIIKNRWCQIIGSDSHNDRRRNFCLNDAIDLISNRIDPKLLVIENPRKVLNGEEILVDVNYEKVKDKQGIIYQIKSKMGLKS